MLDEPRSVIEDVRPVPPAADPAKHVFFNIPQQLELADSHRKEAGSGLFVRPLAIVHTGDARTHVRGTRWTHVPRSCMETSEIIRSSRRPFPGLEDTRQVPPSY